MTAANYVVSKQQIFTHARDLLFFSFNNNTKANTLESLEPLLEKSQIEELFIFTTLHWENHSSEIVNEIKNDLIEKKNLLSIESLKKNIDYAILLAWNFSKEIIQNNKKFLKKGGKFIIPIPKIKIVSKNNYKSLRL